MRRRRMKSCLLSPFQEAEEEPPPSSPRRPSTIPQIAPTLAVASSSKAAAQTLAPSVLSRIIAAARAVSEESLRGKSVDQATKATAELGLPNA
jgi:hypothetical protein